MENAIIFMCLEDSLTRERRGYFKAFKKKIECFTLAESSPCEELEQLIPRNINPILVLNADAYPRILPRGLASTPIPTACFSIDTYEYVQHRIRSSMLFDYAFVFHPGFDDIFQKAGHPRAICLPHAVESDLFIGKDLERIYQVGWVGRTDGKNYAMRRRCIERLKSTFEMNKTDYYYSPEEMAVVYQRSKIVVNFGRDDYPQDANLRCFEAMAAGALLITAQPTELEQLGFVPGVHYLTYSRESEINPLVSFYLQNEANRTAIAKAGQELVLQKHTYDCRVQMILNILAKDDGKLFAPARTWNPATVQAIYARYFAEYLMLDIAFRELKQLRQFSPLLTWSIIPILVKAFLIKLRELL